MTKHNIWILGVVPFFFKNINIVFCNLFLLNHSCVWIGVYLVLTLQKTKQKKNCLTFLLGSCNFGTVATTGRKEQNVVEPPTCYSIASSRPYTLHHRVATKVKEAAGGRSIVPLFPLPKPHDPELAAQGRFISSAVLGVLMDSSSAWPVSLLSGE